MNCIKCGGVIIDGAAFCHHCGHDQSKPVKPKKRRRKSPHGGGSVYKLKDNRKRPWAARGPSVKTGTGSHRPLIGYFETEAEGWDALRNLPGAVVTGKYNYTMEDVRERWKIAHYRAIQSDKGREGYDNAWRHMESIAGMKMRDVDTDAFQQVVDSMIEKGLSRSSCEKVQQLASQLCQWAITNDIITKNYARGLELQLEEKKDKKIFTSAEIDAIEGMCTDPKLWEPARITMCWIYTGTRTAELLQIESSKVYPQQHFMIGGLKTEEGKDRIIPIHPRIQDYIHEWYMHGGPWLIPNGNLTCHSATYIRKKFYELMDHLNITDVEPRTCRRTNATMLADAGVREELLSKLLGHVDYDTSMIYIQKNLQDIILANRTLR